MARGTLRIYLGASPGVGKTYKMMGEGLRRRSRGTDVVIGVVETPADLVDPGPDGATLPRGPVDVSFESVTFAYPGGPPRVAGAP